MTRRSRKILLWVGLTGIIVTLLVVVFFSVFFRRVNPVPWNLVEIGDDQRHLTVHILMAGSAGGCSGYHGTEVEETSSAVRITTFVWTKTPLWGSPICTADLGQRFITIRLKVPLGNRNLQGCMGGIGVSRSNSCAEVRGRDFPRISSQSTMATDERAEVEHAYLRFWSVWAASSEKLDPSQLDRVATGEALEALKEAVETQRANNQPTRIRVEHNYQIGITDVATASVDDHYVNHSQRLDPKTMEPIEPDPNAEVRKSHTMKKVEGVWKVSQIIEYR